MICKLTNNILRGCGYIVNDIDEIYLLNWSDYHGYELDDEGCAVDLIDFENIFYRVDVSECSFLDELQMTDYGGKYRQVSLTFTLANWKTACLQDAYNNIVLGRYVAAFQNGNQFIVIGLVNGLTVNESESDQESHVITLSENTVLPTYPVTEEMEEEIKDSTHEASIKARLVLTDNSIVEIQCDGNPVLTAEEIEDYIDELKSVWVGSCVTSIGDGAFNRSTVRTVDLSDSSVTSIGDDAFKGCESLGNMTIPSTVTSIGDNAFDGCTSMTKLTMESATPPTLGTDVFAHTTFDIYVPCASLEAYQQARNWSYWSSRITCDTPIEASGQITAKFNVTSTSEPTQIFDSQSTALLRSIEVDGVTLNRPTSTYTFSTAGTHTITYQFVDGTMVGNYSFNNVTDMTEVTHMSHSFETILSHAFYGCSGLTSVYIPDSVTLISNSVFQGCTSLTSVDIPNSVQSIYYDAFNGCSGLTTLTIPNSVTEIGDDAFRNCTGLARITCLATTPPTILSHVFDNTNNCPIYVPCASLSAYQTAWSTYSSRITCDQPVTDEYITAVYDVISTSENTKLLGDDAVSIETRISEQLIDGVQQQSIITEYTFPTTGEHIAKYKPKNNVTDMEPDMFSHLTQLREVIIPSGIQTVCGLHNSSVQSVTLPNTVTEIGLLCFADTQNLTSIDIPNSVTTINTGAFRYCTGLQSIDIPNSVTTMGNYCFQACSGLRTVTIGTGIQSIGGTAFHNCTNLASVTVLATTPPTLGYMAFDYTNDCPIYVPLESVEAYRTAWSAYSSRIFAEQHG